MGMKDMLISFMVLILFTADERESWLNKGSGQAENQMENQENYIKNLTKIEIVNLQNAGKTW